MASGKDMPAVISSASDDGNRHVTMHTSDGVEQFGLFSFSHKRNGFEYGVWNVGTKQHEARIDVKAGRFRILDK